MSAEWTITGLTYDRDKAERRVDGNNPQVSCPVLFSAQCASFSCFMTSDINPSMERSLIWEKSPQLFQSFLRGYIYYFSLVFILLPPIIF